MNISLSRNIFLALGASCSMCMMARVEAHDHIPPTTDFDKMVLIQGGQFDMGDTFGEGAENERPVHSVTLSDFHISKFEVTVAEFREFVDATKYVTNGEARVDSNAQARILAKFGSPDLSDNDRLQLRMDYLAYGGTAYWDADGRKWAGYRPSINWRNPGIEQADNHPILAISPLDAMHYCNWLSEQAGLPVAYDLSTRELLDKHGRPTSNAAEVVGYRLPTEAEWEYAAREGGKKVRFGNGKQIARSSEMNFQGDRGEYTYLETDSYVAATTPVGSYMPNALGLYDMSGNAWEWVSDSHVAYSPAAQVDPYNLTGILHSARGGRWGGDAREVRVSHRDPYPYIDRCNNTGFRVARSAD